MTGGAAALWNDEDIADTLTRKAVAFLENQKAGQPFFLSLALHDIHEPMVPHPRGCGTSGCGWRGDVIYPLNWTVGEVLGAFDRRGLAQNTLVIFSSDNGGAIRNTDDDGTNHLYALQPPTALCAVSRVRSTKVAIAFRFSPVGRRAFRPAERPTR